MNSLEQDARRRNRKIAQNEQAHRIRSEMRLSIWAVAIALCVVLVGWLLMR